MSRHDSLIIKETHRGLLYEDGVFREVLFPGKYQIPRSPSKLAAFFGAKGPKVEVSLVDIRGRDRTIVVQDVQTADGVSISASFVVQFRVDNPVAALHEVKSFEERLYAEAQTAARRILRGMSLEEVLIARDEIGEELLRETRASAAVFGLDVSGIDFKDLIVPEKLRNLMNQAALGRRLRRTEMDDDLRFEALEEENDLILTSNRFDRAHHEPADDDGEGLARPEKLAIRPHTSVEPRPELAMSSVSFAFEARRRSS